MEDELQEKQIEGEMAPEGAIDVGVEILAWEAWEFPPVERSRRWYFVAALIGLGLLLYAVFTANFVFGLIILMFAILTIMRDLRQPKRIPVIITTGGLVMGNEFHRFEDMRDFSITYEPPEVSVMYLTFRGQLQPMLSVDLDGMNPNDVRKTLLPYLYENLEREGESLTDVLRRVYKL